MCAGITKCGNDLRHLFMTTSLGNREFRASRDIISDINATFLDVGTQQAHYRASNVRKYIS